MKGIDVHLDTDIGKRFTLLGHTLTLLAGEADESLIDAAHTAKHIDNDNGDFDEYDDDAVDLSSPGTLDNSQEVRDYLCLKYVPLTIDFKWILCVLFLTEFSQQMLSCMQNRFFFLITTAFYRAYLDELMSD